MDYGIVKNITFFLVYNCSFYCRIIEGDPELALVFANIILESLPEAASFPSHLTRRLQWQYLENNILGLHIGSNPKDWRSSILQLNRAINQYKSIVIGK